MEKSGFHTKEYSHTEAEREESLGVVVVVVVDPGMGSF